MPENERVLHCNFFDLALRRFTSKKYDRPHEAIETCTSSRPVPPARRLWTPKEPSNAVDARPATAARFVSASTGPGVGTNRSARRLRRAVARKNITRIQFTRGPARPQSMALTHQLDWSLEDLDLSPSQAEHYMYASDDDSETKPPSASTTSSEDDA